MYNTTPTLNSIKTTNKISMSVTDVYLKTSDKIKRQVGMLRIRIRWIRKILLPGSGSATICGSTDPNP